MFDGLDGKRVVITGANRGLGFELARQLIDAGAQVWATCRQPTAAGELTVLGPAGVVPCDLASTESMERAVAELRDGLDGIDLLINNAGVDGRAFGATEATRGPLVEDPEVTMAVFRTNVVGPMMLTRGLVPLLEAAAPSLVLNVSSQLGSMVVGNRGRDLGYNASKAGLNMLTVMLAEQLRAKRIALLAVHPGWVQTDMGGPSAQVTSRDSAAALLGLVVAFDPADSGAFRTWQGNEHPW